MEMIAPPANWSYVFTNSKRGDNAIPTRAT